MPTFLVPPSQLEYNFTFPLEENINGEVGQPLDVDRIVFGGTYVNQSTIPLGQFESHSTIFLSVL